MKDLIQAILEAAVIILSIILLITTVLIITRVHERHERIRKQQQRRKKKRQRELKQHENAYQLRIFKRIWALEEMKGNNYQTVSIRGCFSTEEGAEVMKASVSI